MTALTADLQFDVYASLSSSGRNRLRDLTDSFDWIVDEAIKYAVTRLLILGDIHDDRSSISLPVIDAVSSTIRRNANRIEIGILPGNHDSYLRTPEITSVSMFIGLPNVTVCTSPRLLWDTFGMVPWYERAEDLERGVKKVHKLGAKYLCTHALLEGAVPGGRGIPLVTLHEDWFKHVFVGDRHAAIEMTPKILYLGGSCQIDFRDAGSPRGFWLLDEKRDKLDFIENTISPRFHLLENPTDADIHSTAIGAKDYVRVQGRPPKKLAKLCKWVECEAPVQEVSAPRLDIRSSQEQSEIVRRYYKHTLPKKPKTVKRLTALTLDILEEAKGQTR